MRANLFALAIIVGAMGAASADTPNYKHFFDGNNQSFHAYIDLNNQSTEANGYRDVSVRMDSFQGDMIALWKNYYANPERISYATETYAVDCSARMTQERIVTLFDSAGVLLTQTNLDKPIKTPTEGSMSFYVLKEVCGG